MNDIQFNEYSKTKFTYRADLPYVNTELMEKYTMIFDPDTNYKGYILNDLLEIVQREDCSIKNDGSYNYHNNYDDSENTLFVGDKKKFWTPSLQEITKIQQANLDVRIFHLTEEVERLEKMVTK